jgi:hypothetical protein
MIPFKTTSTKSSPVSVPQSKTSQLVDGASIALEATLEVLELLGSVTDKVPYLNIITGCISKLIKIRNVRLTIDFSPLVLLLYPAISTGDDG